MRIGCLWLLLLLLSSAAEAQHALVYSQYFVNPYVYNPALAGVEGHPAVFLVVRQQWLGVEGAPLVSHANWHTPMRGGVGLGAIFTNDTIGPLQRNSFKFSASYLLNLDRTHFFRFGMSLGASVRSVDFEELTAPSYLFNERRTALSPYLDNTTTLLGDLGLMYHFGRFNAGLSLPELLSASPLDTQLFSVPAFRPWNNILFKLYYRHSFFGDRIAIDPNILYKYSATGNSQYELTMLFHIYHWVWTGLSYRQDAGFVGLLGAKFNRYLALGYAYEPPNTHWAAYAPAGTHEVHLGFHVGSRRGHVQHAHSFIKSHAKTREDRLKEAEELAQAAAAEAAAEAAKQKATEAALVVPDGEGEEELGDDFLDNLSFGEPKPAVKDAPVKAPADVSKPSLPAAGGAAIPADGVSTGGEVVMPVVDSKEAWKPVTEDLSTYRETPEGMEKGVKMVEETPLPDKRYALGWVPVREKETRRLDRNLPLRKRVGPEGREEIVAVWNVHDVQGEKTQDEEIIFPIYSAEELQRVIREAGGVDRKAIALRVSDTKEGIGDSGISLLGAIVRKGGHLMELPLGSYVVVGSFMYGANANRLATRIGAAGYSARVGFNSEVKRFYVTIYESHDVEVVRMKRDEFRKNPLFREAWVLTVIN